MTILAGEYNLVEILTDGRLHIDPAIRMSVDGSGTISWSNYRGLKQEF